MGRIKCVALLGAIGSIASCEATGPNKLDQVELQLVTFADGSQVPVCTETSVEKSQIGYIDLAAFPSANISAFKGLSTDPREIDRLQREKVKDSFWYMFANNSGGDFTNASVRSGLARCDFDIPGGTRQSTLFNTVVGSPSSLKYELHHKDGDVKYIVVRRHDRTDRQ